ncbi:unnamed protein product [Agarophyton chilense]
MATRYLFAYNAVMTAGWSIVLLRLLQALVNRSSVYDAVNLPLAIFQTAAVLEIVHSLTGIIRAPVATTALQVTSRLILVWGISHLVVSVRSNLSFTTMVLAWALTEIPRYLYFTVSSVATHVPYWLTYLRYSTFLPLYPLGASSEWFTMYAALPYMRHSKLLSISLPNRYNFAFDYHVCAIIILALYIPGLPHMYFHMLRQRRKYIAAPPAVKGAKAA